MTQELVLPHLVAAFLPLVPQLLQQSPDLSAGGHARPPEVVAAHGERGDGPPPHVPEEPVLALVLQQLTHVRRGVGSPALSAKAKRLVSSQGTKLAHDLILRILKLKQTLDVKLLFKANDAHRTYGGA